MTNTYDIMVKSYNNGKLKKASILCQKLLESNEFEDDNEKLFDIILYLLNSAEFLIQIESQPTDYEQDWIQHLDRLKEVAQASQKPELIIRSQIYRGKFLRILSGMSESLQTLQDVEIKYVDDLSPLDRIVLYSELGHLLVHESLENGLKLQHEALSTYSKEFQKLSPPPFDAQRYFYLTQGYIGIGEMDQGYLGSAKVWLEQSVNGLRRLGLQDALMRMLNYQAQLQMSFGEYELADETLDEVLELGRVHYPQSMWHAYNLALRAKNYLDWRKDWSNGEETIIAAYHLSLDKYNHDLSPLILNYYAEFLINSESNIFAPEQAKNILLENIRKLKKTQGALRSIVTAYSMLGRLYLSQNELKIALSNSTKSIQYLENYGNLPAICLEEIYYWHYLILLNNGIEDSNQYLKKAYEHLQIKLHSISSQNQKNSFLENVLINKKIIDATQKYQNNK